MRIKAWESRYADPEYRIALQACGYNHDRADAGLSTEGLFLRSVEDGYVGGHPIIAGRTIVLANSDTVSFAQIVQVKSFANANRLRILNCGWTPKGFALTFKTESMACKFRLLFAGTTTVPA